LKIEVKKKIDVISDFRTGQKGEKVKRQAERVRNFKTQNQNASKKPLMLAGFVRLLKNDFHLCVMRSGKTNPDEGGLAGTLVTIIFLAMPRFVTGQNDASRRVINAG
jgi:hypothetical protein